MHTSEQLKIQSLRLQQRSSNAEKLNSSTPQHRPADYGRATNLLWMLAWQVFVFN